MSRWRDPKFAIPAVAALVSIPIYLFQLYDRLSPVNLDSESVSTLEPLVRQINSSSHSDSERDARLDAELAQFTAQNRLRHADVQHAARKILQRIKLSEESIFRGGDLFSQKRFVEARSEFESATEIDSNSVHAWSSLGAASMLLGDVEAARYAYDKALALDSNDWQVQYNFGLFFARTGHPDEALGHLRAALTTLGDDFDRRAELKAVLEELKSDPSLHELRDEPGFAALVRIK